MLEESFRRLRTDRIELVEVHNLMGTEVLLPVLAEYKAEKRIKYLGVTTSNDSQHAATADILRKYRLDFVQVNYSIDDRESAQTLLPLAQERGAAVSEAGAAATCSRASPIDPSRHGLRKSMFRAGRSSS